MVPQVSMLGCKFPWVCGVVILVPYVDRRSGSFTYRDMRM